MKTPNVFSQHVTDLVKKDKALQQLVASCAEFSTASTQHIHGHQRDIPDSARSAPAEETKPPRQGTD
jgi:hypothetical protein